MVPKPGKDKSKVKEWRPIVTRRENCSGGTTKERVPVAREEFRSNGRKEAVSRRSSGGKGEAGRGRCPVLI